MRPDSNLIGCTVTVYDRYLFAVPVRGVITAVSEKDGAYQVDFFQEGGQNVIRYSGGYFHHQQCRIETPKKISEAAATKEIYKEAMELWGPKNQRNMLAEECAGLAAAVHRYHRGRSAAFELCDKIADVEITIAQLRIMYAHLIDDRKDYKLSRLEKRLKKEK